MDDSLVRPEPAYLRVLRQSLRDDVERRHERFDFTTNQFSAEQFDRLAHQRVFLPQSEHHARAGRSRVTTEQRGSQCVLSA